MKCVYVYFLAAIAFVGATQQPCEKDCPKIYKPVCGYDGQTYKFFHNSCLMEVGSCTDATTYSLAPMSHCLIRSERQCQKVYPLIYAPVCATDGQTSVVFSNQCMFEAQACQDSKPWVLTSMDKCNVRSATSCEKACPKILKPVCGYDGQNYKIFDNSCLMEVGSCTDATTYSLAPMSHCLIRSERQCQKVCPLIYAPVCATDGQTSVVFSNQCMFEAQACQDSKPWVLTSMDKCNVRSATSCEKACPKILKPVCGYDGQNYKIFDNSCLMEVGSCTDATTYSSAPMSQCLMRSEKECPKVCPYIYLPVCATDGETTVVFSNQCMFEAQACQDSKPWVLTSMDKCNVRSATSCEKACPKILKPVCGYDGQNYKIFDNSCLMEVGSCTDATTYSSAPMSQCLMRSEKECPKVCPNIYLPVCATDGETTVVFVNPCVVEAQACKDSKPWVLTSMDKCNVRSATPCEKACPKIYKPVCGYDGQTYKFFDNKCLMEVGSCTDATTYSLAPMSHCLMRSERQCHKACPLIYAPVCATDGQTSVAFSNKCIFEAQTCQDSAPWVLTSMDKCTVQSVKKSCDKVCTAIYAPVCGFDGQNYKVFPSECVMEAESCLDSKPYTLVNMNNCESPMARSSCIRACNLNYDPVCGFNGERYQIFGNKCMFEGLNCEDSYTWQEMSLDTCEAHGLSAWA